ncbi:MAG: putative metalloprotease CJM1_0395 family protein [Cellvibrionaceae bacterium]
MITPAIPSNLANAISPFSPVGKLAVGQENIEARNTPFKPVEELPESERQTSRNAASERAAEAETRVGTERGGAVNSGAEQERQEQERLSQEAQEAEQQAKDQQVIQQLAERDREVRAHEQAHAAVGGQLAGSPSYTFERGPDGVSYAVGGEVSISSGVVPGDPEATLANARIVQQAALAPADPSPQDRRVAADAAQVQQQAIQDIAQQAQEARAEVEAEIETEREQKAELAREREEELREAQRQSQTEDDAASAARASSAQDEFINTNIDINQRLIDIGVNPSPTPVGNLLNQIA